MLPRRGMVSIFGIVNVTRDSFSDGGRFLEPAAALAQAERLLTDGADVIDVGAESTHPDAEDVDEDAEIRRLTPVVQGLLARGANVSVDTCKPAVMAAMTALGVHWLNDVHGFRTPAALATAAAAPPHVRFVVMHSRSAAARAERRAHGAGTLLAELHAFFAERLAAFRAAGVAPERLAFDPGMGFFLGSGAQPSLTVLRHLDELRRFAVPLLVSVSRKSFLGEVTGRPVAERGPGTLAAELWAARHGADFVRTHDVAALRAGIAVERAIAAAP
ncbi:MAG: dihydropteroate synthase [Planctomycetes bacterium]|nr:dihydropteroate synthase [Planctomycetota bacterium]